MNIHVGTEKYLHRIWMQQYKGYVMNILRRWSDGKLSVRFEKV